MGQTFMTYAASVVPQETVLAVGLDDDIGGAPSVIVDLFQRQHGKELAQAFYSMLFLKGIGARGERQAGIYHPIAAITWLHR